MSTWTTDPPTQPGFYWIKFPYAETPELIEVLTNLEEKPVFTQLGDWQYSYCHTVRPGTLWSGPILPPPL